MKKQTLLTVIAACLLTNVNAQELSFSQRHGFYESPFDVEITINDSVPHNDATIHYTLDGSEPTAESPAYSKAIHVAGNTLLRACAIADTGIVTPVATSTYLFIDDILKQSNTPAGYPSEWGAYTNIWGTATADYEMDPEMTGNPSLRPKIIEGLKQLPVLSIVTDKDNLFSHENDSVTGGIYIFTGPPVGDPTGHGWTRPASAEFWEPSAQSDHAATGFSVNCGLRLHGGHGRLAEKNPKHSLRLVFKPKYGGPKTLKYPLFGDGEPAKFDQLVLRCHFGNSWQHWAEGNRQKAQYTRDVWARRMQRKMGWTSANARYVNLFLNGMYWGMYNIAERVDDQFGKDHLGGSKDDVDVIKIEEDGGNHIEAAEGSLEAWELMTNTANAVGASPTDTNYLRLQGLGPDGESDPTLEALLDIDAFIDYMLINQYGGNTDWDHHNWYALRRGGADSQGFRFLCWDTEIIFENERENVLSKNNGKAAPTGIFQSLLRNDDFARRYVRRAKEVLTADGLLGQQSVVQLWDSLYNTISKALYAEAARWGDYRRDVHPWQSRGQLYTVDEHYMNERNRLLNQYFPVRTGNVLNNILAYVQVDDFEKPDDWTNFTAQMFHEWDGTGADATVRGNYNVDWNLGATLGGGGVVAGTSGVEEYRFADLSQYGSIVLRGSGSGVRLLANRLVAHGPWKQIVVSFNEGDQYWDNELGAIVVPLQEFSTMDDTDGNHRVDGFVHLNAIKVDWSSNATVKAIYLTPGQSQDIAVVHGERRGMGSEKHVYDLQGRRLRLAPGAKGLFIVNGKKLMIRN